MLQAVFVIAQMFQKIDAQYKMVKYESSCYLDPNARHTLNKIARKLRSWLKVTNFAKMSINKISLS